jgi:hypothetical protein
MLICCNTLAVFAQDVILNDSYNPTKLIKNIVISSCVNVFSFYATVLDYASFSTPNGDGINDEWKIKNIDIFPNAVINIFDRYGKLLKELNTANYSWNGKYIGR